MADGCIFQRDELHQKLLKIAIHTQDRDLLEHFKKDIESNNPIRNVSNKEAYVIDIVSDKICDDLEQYGITPRKTWGNSIDILKIPREYWIDYIIGFFDGDGSITNPKKYTPANVNIAFCGNEQNITQISQILNSYHINSSIIQDKRKYTNNFYNLILPNTTAKYIFAKLYVTRLYETLVRKKERMLKFLDFVENNNSNRSENIRAIKIYKTLYK